jgi:hypothetical protein
MEIIDLQKFELPLIKPNRLVMLIGRRGSGKSTLQREILYSLRDRVDYFIAVTPTRDTESEWLSFLPRSMIHRSLDKDLLARLLDHQDSISRQKGKRRRSICVLWDDVMFIKSALKGESVRELFYNGRHLDIFFVNACQYMMDVSPDLRLQVDYLFAFYDQIPENRNKIRRYYCGQFRAEAFDATFRACTTDFKCFVVDNTEHEVRWFKADINLPPFKLGSPVFWLLDEEFGRDEDTIAREKQQQNDKSVSVSLY